MLQVAVHGDLDIALGLMKARRKRRRLAEIAAQTDHLQVAIGLHQIGQQLEAAIRGCVIHEQNLVRPLQSLEDHRQPVVQRQDREFLVMDRDDNRQHEWAKY